MRLTKHITFKSDNQIWRLKLNEIDDLLIEIRDTSTKEVSYNIINIPSKKTITNYINLPDNIFLGFEAFYSNFIFFHKFVKPDLPMHLGIFTFDINVGKIIWENLDYNFLLINNNSLIAQKQGFDENILVELDLLTGNFIQSLSLSLDEIDEMHNGFMSKYNFDLYGYPEEIMLTDYEIINNVIEKYTKSFPLKYNPQLLIYEDLFLSNFHLLTNKGITNYFVAVNNKGRIVEEIILNKSVNAFVPESFFTYKNYLILLKEKSELLIYKME